MPHQRLKLLLLIALISGQLFAQGIITTYAGTTWVYPGLKTAIPAVNAPLGYITAVAVARNGDLIVSDPDNAVVLRMASSGLLRVIAGNGLRGYSGDGGPAVRASLLRQTAIAIDASDNLYIAGRGPIAAGSRETCAVRRVTPDGTISTFAGGGLCGSSPGALDGVEALAVDPFGNLVVTSGPLVVRINPDKSTTTIAGYAVPPPSGPPSFGSPAPSPDGGPATAAYLSSPVGLAYDGLGNLYIIESARGTIRRVDPAGIITTLVNNLAPVAVAADRFGIVYFAGIEGKVARVSGGRIETVAGNFARGFAGDGGPALRATLFGPRAIAVDNSGALMIADSGNSRVRRAVVGGNIQTIAGNGQYRLGGDGGPAIFANLNGASGLASDTLGNLYISDDLSARIRKISPSGLITTIAGNGDFGYTGDNGPALAAGIGRPHGLTVDQGGTVYFVDWLNSKLRRVTPNGIITTIPVSIGLQVPEDVTIDAQGNLYVADSGDHRIVRITPSGTATVMAGGRPITGPPIPGAIGDGGPATDATIIWPTGVVVDKAGNLYLTDASTRIRIVSPAGVISTLANLDAKRLSLDASGALYAATGETVERISQGLISRVAGNGNGYVSSGDGGLALNAGMYAVAIAFDPGGALYIADQPVGPDNREARVRKVLTAPPTWGVTSDRLDFRAVQGGAPPAPQELGIGGTAGLQFSISAIANDGGAWLSSSILAGFSPASARISVDPAGLSPGYYSGVVNIIIPTASPSSRSVFVSLQISAAPGGASVRPSPAGLRFNLLSGAGPVSQGLSITNFLVQTVHFTATPSTFSGGAWLQVSPGGGDANAFSFTRLTVTANPAGLSPGVYTGAIFLNTPGASIPARVPVTLTISGAAQSPLLLSVQGLSFTAVPGGGTPPTQRVGIVNTGVSPVAFSASVDQNWIQLSSTSGSAQPISLAPAPSIEISVNPAGLATGTYFGRISVTQFGGSPQQVAITLNVLRTGSSPGPVVRPAGLVFTTARGASPGSQDVTISNLTDHLITFTSADSVVGQPWFSHLPPSGAVTPQQPAGVIVQPNTSALQAGVYRGTIVFSFSDSSVRTVALLLVVTQDAALPRAPVADDQGSCAPARLLPVLSSFTSGEVAIAGQSNTIEVQIVDDCANPASADSVWAEFDNGDSALPLVSLADGTWMGSWIPTLPSGPEPLNLTIRASGTDPALSGSVAATVNLVPSPGAAAPVITGGGVVSAAQPQPFAPVALGGSIGILGTNLADSSETPAFPLGTELGGAQVLLEDTPLPLMSVSSGRINAVIPYDAPVNTPLHLVVVRGGTQSIGEPVVIVTAQPAVFSIAGPNGSAAPLHAGDRIVIYCEGLGPVDPAIRAGEQTPLDPPLRAVSLVEVNIGGVAATVESALLTPGAVALYQVTAIVPEGIAPGDAIPLTLTAAGNPSVPIAVGVGP